MEVTLEIQVSRCAHPCLIALSSRVIACDPFPVDDFPKSFRVISAFVAVIPSWGVCIDFPAGVASRPIMPSASEAYPINLRSSLPLYDMALRPTILATAIAF